MRRKRKIFLYLFLIFILIICINTYENKILFSLKNFSFKSGISTQEKDIIYNSNSLQEELSRFELEKILLDYGMDYKFVQRIEEQKIYEYVNAVKVEIRVNYLKIGRNGKVKYISADQLEKEDINSDKWLYIKKSDYVFTLNEDEITDKQEFVSEIKWLSRQKWKSKFEFAIGAIESAIHFDTLKCTLYKQGRKGNDIISTDLTDKVVPVYDSPYSGIRVVDSITENDSEEMVLYLQYQFGYHGKMQNFISQFRCRQILL